MAITSIDSPADWPWRLSIAWIYCLTRVRCTCLAVFVVICGLPQFWPWGCNTLYVSTAFPLRSSVRCNDDCCGGFSWLVISSLLTTPLWCWCTWFIAVVAYCSRDALACNSWPFAFWRWWILQINGCTKNDSRFSGNRCRCCLDSRQGLETSASAVRYLDGSSSARFPFPHGSAIVETSKTRNLIPYLTFELSPSCAAPSKMTYRLALFACDRVCTYVLWSGSKRPSGVGIS